MDVHTSICPTNGREPLHSRQHESLTRNLAWKAMPKGRSWQKPWTYMWMVAESDTLRCHPTWRAGKWTIEISDFP